MLAPLENQKCAGKGHTNVLVELPHEGNAELANLIVRLALGVKVTATFATAHVDCEVQLANA